MNIPPKYEDVVAQLEAALAREAALREELASQKNHFIIQLQGEKDGDRLQQRLTVAEPLLKRFDTMFSGGICSGPLQDLVADVQAALKPAEVGEGS